MRKYVTIMVAAIAGLATDMIPEELFGIACLLFIADTIWFAYQDLKDRRTLRATQKRTALDECWHMHQSKHSL